MKKPDIIFLAIVLIEITATAIIYFFFSKWTGGACDEPSIFNPFGMRSPGMCILIALSKDQGGVPFYVSLDITILTITGYGIYKLLKSLQKK